jgi:hypothetical protein
MFNCRFCRTTIFGLLLWTCLSEAAAANTDWYKCQSAAQCVVVKGNCGVEWAANNKFAEQSRNNPLRSESPCKKPLEDHPANSFAICIDSQCAIYPPGLYAGGKPISQDACAISSCWGHLGCNYFNCTRKDGSKYTKFTQ